MSREKEPAVGIDLGTTYSCIGVWRHGRAEIIINYQGNRITPSSVAFTETDRFIGEAALNQADMNPANTIFAAKRLIGRRYSEESVQNDAKLWPFKVIAGDDDKPIIVVKYMEKEKHFTAEEISSMVLHKMKESAEYYLGRVVRKAVVAVPAYFNYSQRQATKDAATIAGLDVLQIVNEPTAAAVAYSLQKKDMDRTGKRIALIFDLGGGTLDVSLVEINSSGLVKVIATDGNPHLGGHDFDSRMVLHAIEIFSNKYHKDLQGNARAVRRLRTECEKAKRVLSFNPIVQINVDMLFDGIDFHMVLSRAKFEEINKDLFDRCLEPVEQCLKYAQTEKSDIHDVVLVGGSTRIPKIQTMLKDFFGIDYLYTRVNADEAVAVGASILAAELNGRKDYNEVSDLVLMDITPLNLGINIRGGITHVVIPMNTRIPCEISKTYTTPDDNMKTLRFQVCQGASRKTTENEILGEFCIGIRMAPKGAIRVKIVFKIDESGILHVSAKDMDSGQEAPIRFTYVAERLSKDVIERMMKDAERYKIEDALRMEIFAGRDELQEYLSRIKGSIEKYGVWSLIEGSV